MCTFCDGPGTESFSSSLQFRLPDTQSILWLSAEPNFLAQVLDQFSEHGLLTRYLVV